MQPKLGLITQKNKVVIKIRVDFMWQPQSGWRHFRQRTDGITAVEFALLLPVIFFILCGIMDFGWIFYQMAIVNEAAREAARIAAVASPHIDKTTVQGTLRSEYGDSISLDNLDYDSPSSGKVTAKVSKPVPLLSPIPDLGAIGVPQLPTSVSGKCVMTAEN